MGQRYKVREETYGEQFKVCEKEPKTNSNTEKLRAEMGEANAEMLKEDSQIN